MSFGLWKLCFLSLLQSPSISETVAHSVDSSCGSPSSARVWGVRSSFALHQLDETRKLKENRRKDYTGVSYNVGALNKTLQDNFIQ